MMFGFGGGETNVFDSAVTAGFVENIERVIPFIVQKLEINFSILGIGGHSLLY
jgi:hypothetical protein